MHAQEKEILVRMPKGTLALLRNRNKEGRLSHAFVLYPPQGSKAQEIRLLSGDGHDVSRRDMHYALYLFQRFYAGEGAQRAVAHG